ncbi:MAG: ribosomal RNA small subunit methyltransferase A [Pyrinomonadaceae bacterium]|nr:ribosomal RNA small subunit methyltransferase A [Pyrinomonadaceae bacterium]
MSDQLSKTRAGGRHRAKKSFGQNFLVDSRIIERIVNELAPRADETIVEIGAGQGALTSHVARRAGKLFAVEFDRDLVPVLRDKFAAQENLTVVEADALEVEFCRLIEPAETARVVANLPYNISTAILQRLIAQRACLPEMFLMLQREVAERVVAAPGASGRGFLSVLVEAYCEADILFDVAPEAFRPVPKVWSTVVRLSARPQINFENEDLMWQTVSAGFAQRRKTIFNNLRAASPDLRTRIEEAGGAEQILFQSDIALQRRAETLTLDEWTRLVAALS